MLLDKTYLQNNAEYFHFAGKIGSAFPNSPQDITTLISGGLNITESTFKDDQCTEMTLFYRQDLISYDITIARENEKNAKCTIKASAPLNSFGITSFPPKTLERNTAELFSLLQSANLVDKRAEPSRLARIGAMIKPHLGRN